MKKSAIDIGTNSVRLLLSEALNGKLIYREKSTSMTRLGKDLHKTGVIEQQAIENTLSVLCQYKAIADAGGYHLQGIIATSAVRDANNSEKLIGPAFEQLGLKIEVISGDEEARLGYLGAIKGLEQQSDKPVLLLDIGGGSTELILGMGDTLKDMVSINMGAVRMTEAFHSEVEPHHLDIEGLRLSIKALLTQWTSGLENCRNWLCVGIGGTITTLAAMTLEMEVYDPECIHGFRLEKTQVENLIASLSQKTLEEKMQLNGLNPKRADIILSGAIILSEVLAFFEQEAINVSEYDNLEGIVMSSM